MTRATEWSPETISRVVLLNKSKCLADIARDVGIHREVVRTKLKSLGIEPFNALRKPCVQERPLAKPREWRMAGVWFEDIEDPDCDRFTGRRPLPTPPRSDTGSSADLCVNWAF